MPPTISSIDRVPKASNWRTISMKEPLGLAPTVVREPTLGLGGRTVEKRGRGSIELGMSYHTQSIAAAKVGRTTDHA